MAPSIDAARVENDGIPVVKTTSVKTSLLAKNGQTIFIGGLIQDSKLKQRDIILLNPSSIEILLDRVDLWLVDLKVMDPELHQEYTGASNNRILVNLKRLLQATKGEIIIRIPMIRNITTTAENILATIRKIRYIELLP